MVKGVIFDMDGLMFDTERLWDTLWEPACRELGLPLPPDMEKFTAGGRGLAGENLCRHVASYIPGDPKKVLAKVWQLADTRFAEGVPCKKGLKELLMALEDLGMPRIVASSSPRNMIEMNLQTTGTLGATNAFMFIVLLVGVQAIFEWVICCLVAGAVSLPVRKYLKMN